MERALLVLTWPGLSETYQRKFCLSLDLPQLEPFPGLAILLPSTVITLVNKNQINRFAKACSVGFKAIISLLQTDIATSGLPNDTDVVINVAGQNVLDAKYRWTSEFKQKVITSRVDTTRTLAKAIGNSSKPPKVFVTISGVGYYPPSVSVEYDEDSHPEKSDFFSELCESWENAGRLADNCATRRVIIRSGVVLGRDGGMIKQINIPFLLGLGGPIGSGKQYFPWIHIKDLVNLFVFSAKEEKVTGVLNGVAPEIVTNSEFVQEFGKRMRRPTYIPLPEFAVNIIFGQERASMMTQGQRVCPRRVLNYGFQYSFPTIKSACIDLVG